MRRDTLVIIACLGLTLAIHRMGSEVSSPTRSEVSLRNPASVVDPLDLKSWIPPWGETWTFQFDRDVISYLNDQRVFAIETSGIFQVERLTAEGHELFVRISTETPARIEFGFQASIRRADDGVLSVDPVVRGFAPRHTAEELQELAAISRDILRTFLFPLDQNSIGKYRARYLSRSDHLEKTILSFEDSEWRVLRSYHRQFADRSEGQDDFVRIDGELRTRQSMEYAFRRISQEKTNSSRLAFELSQMSEVNTEKAINAVDVGATLPEVEVDDHFLDGFSNYNRSGMDQLRDVRSLAHLIKKNPQRVTELKESLSREDVSDPAWATGIAALVESGAPSAEEVMTELYRVSQSHKSRSVQILNAFSLAQRPLARKTLEWLIDQGPSGLLALGAAIPYQESADQKLAIEAIRAAAAQAKDRQRKIAALDAMGNAGSAHFLPVIQEEIASRDEWIRSHAVLALRFQDPLESRALLVKAEATDPSPRVKAAARRALQIQKQHR